MASLVPNTDLDVSTKLPNWKLCFDSVELTLLIRSNWIEFEGIVGTFFKTLLYLFGNISVWLADSILIGYIQLLVKLHQYSIFGITGTPTSNLITLRHQNSHRARLNGYHLAPSECGALLFKRDETVGLKVKCKTHTRVNT